MNFEIYLDPTHKVLRLTLLSPVVNLEGAKDVYSHLKEISSHGGPYAAIIDYSAVTGTTLTVHQIRKLARLDPCVPNGRLTVFVGLEPNIYGLTRIFQMDRKAFKGERIDVVETLEEAYKLVGTRHKNFTVHLFP